MTKSLPFIEGHGLKLSKSSFAECYIDIGNLVDNVDILDIYPEIGQWAEFKNYTRKFSPDISNTAVIKFIVCFYDPKSPIFKFFTNWQERKLASAEYSDFRQLKGGTFSLQSQEIMNCNNSTSNAMTVRYCVNAHGHSFAGYVKLTQIFNENTLQNEGVTAKIINTDMLLIKQYEDMFLAGDPTAALHQVLYKITTDEELKIQKLRPEHQERYWKNKLVDNG